MKLVMIKIIFLKLEKVISLSEVYEAKYKSRISLS